MTGTGRAEREFKRAIELNPNYATVHQWYSNLLDSTGRLDDAIAEGKRAQEADPLSLAVNSAAGETYYLARRYDQAMEQLRKTLEMDSNFYVTHWFVAMLYEQTGRYEEAIKEAQKAVSLSAGCAANAQALEWLERAYEDRSERLRWIKVWPAFDSLRGEQRFHDLLRRMRLE